MRLVAKGTAVVLKLEDKTSGALFANCPIDTYPGVAIEAVSDSSRYFVIRVQDDNGRSAFLGLGFGDRSDSFDLNVALQDHFKWVKNQEQIEKEKTEPKQELDLGFKEGETIKINMRITVGLAAWTLNAMLEATCCYISYFSEKEDFPIQTTHFA